MFTNITVVNIIILRMWTQPTEQVIGIVKFQVGTAAAAPPLSGLSTLPSVGAVP